MNRLEQEMRILPRAVWVIAVCVWIAFGLLMWLVPMNEDPKLMLWPLAGKVAFCVGIGLPLAIYTLLIGYVYADARRRGMRYVLWTLLAVFIPNAIGIILYFIMREPLLKPCPKCGTPARSGYAFCAVCGTALAAACPQCKCAVEPAWSHCVRCGAALR